jgi:hypothetical protein
VYILLSMTIMITLTTCTFKINEQPPDVSLVIDNYTVEATQVKVTTTVTYSDNGKMDRIELYDATNLIQTKSVTSKQGSERFVFPVPIEEGKIRQLRLKAKAYDKAGNVSESQEATLTLYFVAPEISIENEYVGSFVDVKIGKGAKLRKIEVYEGGRKIGEKETTKSEGTERVEVEISEDATEIKVKAVNEFNLVTEIKKEVLVDKTAPQVVIKSPKSGLLVGGAVNIEVEATDTKGIGKIELFVDDKMAQQINEEPFILNLDTTKHSDGEHTIKVVAYDKALNMSETSIILKFDNTPPTVNITLPKGDYLTGRVDVNSTVSDVNGISKVELYLNQQKVDEKTQPPYSFSIDGTKYPDGEYRLKVVAYDIVGNKGEALVTARFENNVPEVDIVKPVDGAYVFGITEVEATATDGNGISKVELYFMENKLYEKTSLPYTFILDTKKYSDGTYILKVVAYDAVGKSKAKSITVKVDNNPPNLNIVSPTNGAYVGGTINVSVNANDVGGISKVQLCVDNATNVVSEKTSEPYTFTLNTKDYADGQHLIIAKAYDNVGRVSSHSITVRIDNTAPEVAITKPENNATMRGNVTVEVVATDTSWIRKVELYLDTQKLGEVTASPYVFNFNTSGFTPGQHTLKAKAYDIVGNVGETSIIINIQ